MTESSDGLLVEAAREELRREYEKLRNAKIRLWRSGVPIEEVRKHGAKAFSKGTRNAPIG